MSQKSTKAVLYLMAAAGLVLFAFGTAMEVLCNIIIRSWRKLRRKRN